MKFLKKFVTMCMALSLCLGIGSFAACGGNPADSSSSASTPNSASGYLFKVVTADGKTPEVGVYTIQLCADLCYMPVALDENGTALINASVIMGFPGENTYDIHILSSEMNEDGSWEVAFDGPTVTPATYSSEYIVLTLK